MEKLADRKKFVAFLYSPKRPVSVWAGQLQLLVKNSSATIVIILACFRLSHSLLIIMLNSIFFPFQTITLLMLSFYWNREAINVWQECRSIATFSGSKFLHLA